MMETSNKLIVIRRHLRYIRNKKSISMYTVKGHIENSLTWDGDRHMYGLMLPPSLLTLCHSIVIVNIIFNDIVVLL